MNLPLLVDMTPTGRIVKRRGLGQPGYAENVEYALHLESKGDAMIIQYHGENGNILDEHQVQQVIKLYNKL